MSFKIKIYIKKLILSIVSIENRSSYSLENVAGGRLPKDVALVQRFAAVLRVVLARGRTHGSVDLELEDV